MRIVIDECLDVRLRHQFSEHECVTVQYLETKRVPDIELLEHTTGRFDVLITADVNMEYQQNLKRHPGLAIILLRNIDGSMRSLLPLLPLLHAALQGIQPGQWYLYSLAVCFLAAKWFAAIQSRHPGTGQNGNLSLGKAFP